MGIPKSRYFPRRSDVINEEAEQEDVYCASQDHGYPKRGLGYPANLDEGGRDFPA